jgi:hypothetical protein
MGSTLTADLGTWTNSPTSYSCTWYINDRIEQAAAPCDNLSNVSHFYLKNYYYGEVPSVLATAINSEGSATATSAPTGTYITRAATQAVRADDLDDAIGAATHMNETGAEYWSTVGYSCSLANVSTALTYLPYLNHLRGGWGYENNASLIHETYPNVTFVVAVSCCSGYFGPAAPPDPNTGDTSKAWLLANTGTIESLEGANEIDAETNYSCPLTEDGVCPGNNNPPTQAQINAAYTNAMADQTILWSAFSPVMPVLTPTMQSPNNMVNIYGVGSTGVNPSNFSFVNEHYYTEVQANQGMQWSYLYAQDFQKPSANGVAPVRGSVFQEIVERPTLITETGWMDCPPGRVSGSCTKNTPDATIAKLLPSMLLDAHNAGVYRTFVYQLLDELPDPGTGNGNESYHNELFSLDTLANYSPVSPKPQATALQNLMAFMHDSSASAKTFDPGQWSYSLTGLPDSGFTPPYQKGQSPLLQRGDGKFILAVWDDVVLWDVSAGTAIPGVPAPTHPVLVPVVVPSAVSQDDPVTDTTTTLTPSASMTLDLPDRPIFLLITT